MKLKIFECSSEELQEYLDKYQDKIKFIFRYGIYVGEFNPNKWTLIIDEA